MVVGDHEKLASLHTPEVRAQVVYRDFVQASAHVTITPDAVEVRFGKRAHNPYLLAAGFADTDIAVPWWQDRRLRLRFG